VRVLLYERSPRNGAVRSPWAIKKLNKTHCKSDIANRLEEEAKILKGLSHPNIIGKYFFFFGGGGGVDLLGNIFIYSIRIIIMILKLHNNRTI
jgi:serine/threonine protein kinase